MKTVPITPSGATDAIMRRLSVLETEGKDMIQDLFQAGTDLPSPVAVRWKDISTGDSVAASFEDATSRRNAIWQGGIEPMPFDQFCTILDGCPLFPRQLKVFEDTGLISPYAVIEPRGLHQVCMVWGKGSGKDYMVGKFMAWIFLVLCSLKKDPAQYFDLAPCSRLSLINVASTELQARRVFFRQYLAKFLKHKLFDRFLRTGADPSQTKTGRVLPQAVAKPGTEAADNIIHFRTSPDGIRYECIGVYSMHSKATSLEGHNVFAWVMDEADAFLDNAKRSNAQEVYDVLRSSSQRFQDNWFGMIISYPRVEDGFMMRFYARAKKQMAEKGNESGYYADMGASWEVNPKFNRNNADVVEMYETDYRRANAVYGCVPMASDDGFFDVPERISESVDHSRSPVCIVTEETIDVPMKNGGEMYYISGKVGIVRPVPGYVYFLSGDAGNKRDAYAVSVWHYDGSPESFAWVCPNCARDADFLNYGDYEYQQAGTRVLMTNPDDAPLCGGCLTTAREYAASYQSASVIVAGWYKLSGRSESLEIDAGGQTLNVPRLYEDLIISIKPRRATGSDPSVESGRNRTVHFPSMRDALRELIEKLPVRAARFDPWQTVDVTQELVQSTGADVAEISYSNAEQYRRAKFYKRMLHSGYLTLLPNETRDRELRRLQRIGDYKVDHPSGAGESKDLFDVESACVWTAAKHRDGRLDMHFM